MIYSLKKLLKSNYLFTLGIVICLGWILAAVFAPVIAPYDPITQDLTLRLNAPSASHRFGTDNFGRDIFSRVIYGGRYSLLAGCLSVTIAGVIGTFYGALAGYVGGWLDNVFPISDPGNDHQCGDGLQSVQHHVCSGHRILADLRKAYAKRGFECEGE